MPRAERLDDRSTPAELPRPSGTVGAGTSAGRQADLALRHALALIPIELAHDNERAGAFGRIVPRTSAAGKRSSTRIDRSRTIAGWRGSGAIGRRRARTRHSRAASRSSSPAKTGSSAPRIVASRADPCRQARPRHRRRAAPLAAREPRQIVGRCHIDRDAERSRHNSATPFASANVNAAAAPRSSGRRAIRLSTQPTQLPFAARARKADPTSNSRTSAACRLRL